MAVAGDASLADILAKRAAGEPLAAADELRANAADQALVFGFENMPRPHLHPPKAA